MQKLVYQIMVWIAVFVGATIFFVNHTEEKVFQVKATTAMAEATFPTISLVTDHTTIGQLHGYSSNIDPEVFRDIIMPLEGEPVFYVRMKEYDMTIRKLIYEVSELDTDKVLDSGSISALEKEEEYKTTKVKIKATLNSGTEYGLKLTTVTAVGKKIYFYARIKTADEFYLKEKMAFIENFHEAIFDKEKAEDIRMYLESSNSAKNDTLAYVNLKSSFDVVTWAQLAPKIVGEAVPTVKEINESTAAVQYQYLVSAQMASGTANYYVTEFYRVQYTATRMYLLAYERTMQEFYDSDLTSLAKSELKIGISDEYDMQMLKSANNTRLAFVRERELFVYSLAENKMTKVFSFQGDNMADTRTLYNQNGIQIMEMDDVGNVNFMVYGYMNRGVYEGKIAIVVYRYYALENHIEEQIYIPLEISYQMLKENLNRFSYMNRNQVFYFSLNNNIYSYSVVAKTFSTIAENVPEESSFLLEDGSVLVWQEDWSQIHIMDLETGSQKQIKPPAGQNVKLLGKFENCLLYGYGEYANSWNAPDGTVVFPMAQVRIADANRRVLKNYQADDIYITEAVIRDNVVELTRMLKTGDNYEEEEKDYILNNNTEKNPAFRITERDTMVSLRELYLTLPYGYSLTECPQKQRTVNTIIHEETSLRLEMSPIESNRYYVYAYGNIVESTAKASAAIALADEKMGVVLNQNNQIIWERGGKGRNAMISRIEEIKSSENSLAACLQMLYKYRYMKVDDTVLHADPAVFAEKVDEYLGENAVNMIGVTLDEVLYCVSKKRPVIAMKNELQFVLIIGYDEYNIYIYNPEAREKGRQKIALDKATEQFEKAGNKFISYME